jgi:RTX calcium-binding nonapeptide repeat (4 copies)
VHTYFERIPIAAGDVLGGRFETSPNVKGTPHIFETASASDQAGESAFPGPDLGGSFTATPISNRRVNMRATFEPDDDGDGYGDTSQDLCLGSPLGAGPCTGILFGSALQGLYNASGNKCTFACLRVQTVVAGTPTRAPFDGVVVRWRMLAAPAGSYRIRVLGPLAGSANYSILGSSDAVSVSPAPFGTITTYETRVPIPAGGYVALLPPQFTTQPFREPPLPGSIYTQVNDGPEGSERDVDGISSVAAEPLYDADIEPDADRDGFGDVSQDSCPADGATQDACTQSPVPVAPVDDFPERRSCGGKRATRVGTAGKDDLKGTKRADVIVALGGADTIRALAGNDLVCAGKGRDTVLGGPGKDRLLGEGGVDALRGGPGKDKLIGGPGKDLQRQ